MADMFGAPLGIIASDENIRRNALAGLSAAETLGKLEAQPGERALTAAQTEHQKTLAGLNRAQITDLETKAAEVRRQQAITEQVLQEERELKAAQQKAVSEGRNLTAAEWQQQRTATPVSAAEQLERMANRYRELGMPIDKVADLYNKAGSVAQHAATVASQRATEQKTQLEVARKNAEEFGALAAYGMKGPAQYREMLAIAAQNPTLVGMVGKLPPDFAAARPKLEAMYSQAMTVKDQAAQRARDVEAQASLSRAGAAQVSAAASSRTADARVALINERLAVLKKTGGAADPSVVALREARTAAVKQQMAARDAKDFPPMPLQPNAIDIASKATFTTPSGQKVRAVADPNGAQTDMKGKRFSLVPVISSANDLSAEDLAILNGED